MLDVNTARAAILTRQKTGREAVVSLSGALGLVLAQDAPARTDSPRFDNSAMDGYAVRSRDTLNARTSAPVSLNVVDEIWAGKIPRRAVNPLEAVRIMTGAKLPDGADSVIMQENVLIPNDDTVLVPEPVTAGSHIRKAGEEFRAGSAIIQRGAVLNPAAIGLLAGAGVTAVSVFQPPHVAIISTGSELAVPGENLGPVQIYESNSFAIAAALESTGLHARIHAPVTDDVERLREVLETALATDTHVIITGGVSVGSHDHGKNVLNDCGVKEVFWKVAQKPGKPLYFGVKNDTLVFGLPGNPVSALICYYEFVFPALLKHLGRAVNGIVPEEALGLARDEAVLTQAIIKKSGQTWFLRGIAGKNDGALEVETLRRQNSHMMSSFAKANCLIVGPPEMATIEMGAAVTIHWLP